MIGKNRFMRVTYGLLLILAFVLAGCFQQAGEPLDQTNTGQGVPAGLPSATPLLPDNSDVTPLLPATSTLPPITVISPTQQPLALPSATDESLPTPLVPGTETTENAGGGSFITPSSPLGPVTQEPVTIAPLLAATATPSGLITPTALVPITDSEDGCAYIVQPGDNLFRIAVNHDTTLTELRTANPQIVGDLIQPGDSLNIPGCGGGTGEIVTPPDTGSGDDDTGVVAPVGGTTHTVQRGETLYSIARQYGVTVQAIINANSLTNPNSLTPGQELIIPPVEP
jgi:LysM repeat protein